MSDDKKDDKKDEKKDGAEAKPPAKAKGGGMMMPILAVVLTLGVAVGGAYALVGMLFPVKAAAAEGKDGAAGEHGGEGGEHGAEGKGHEENLLHAATEVVLGEIMSNVRGQAGRRYIKLTIGMWLDNKVASSLAGGGGGGHGGGGGGAGDSIKRILQSQLEEHLKTYELEELTDPNINRNLDRGFRQIIEKELHDLYPALPKETKLVQRIIITNMVVQ